MDVVDSSKAIYEFLFIWHGILNESSTHEHDKKYIH